MRLIEYGLESLEEGTYIDTSTAQMAGDEL
jgi:hypothetical protein